MPRETKCAKSPGECLRETAGRYRQLFEDSSDAIFVADASSHKIIDCNKMAARMTGYSRRELLSMRADRLHPRPVVASAMGSFTKMARGKMVTTETEILTGHGRRIPVAITATLLDVKGRKQLMGIFRDISAQREAERQAAFFKQFAEAAGQGFWMADLGGNIAYVNRALCRLFGERSPGDVCKKNIRRYYQKSWRKRLGREILPTVLSKGQWTGESALISRKGRVVPIIENIFCIRDENLVPQFYANVITDISERKQAEMELKQSGSILASTLESAFSGFLVVDRSGKITHLNRKFIEMWRIPRSVIDSHDDGKALDFVVSQLKDPKGFLRKVRELYSHPARESYDMIEFKDGRFFERYSRPQRIGPQIVGRVWTFHDITGLKQAEEVLARDKAVLEDLVQARSADLIRAQDDLNKARRLSDVGMLAATVAHELRSPLAAIRMAAYNIGARNVDPLLKGHLDNIDKKVIEADQIIKNLLFYSSIKSPHFERVDLCARIEECVALSKQAFREYDVDVDIAIKSRRACVLEADPLQLNEIFHNILNNSYESFNDNRGAIKIAVRPAKNGYITVSFADDGPGIRPGDLREIPTPFFTTKASGIGLGLSVCYQIVRLHNGRIWVKSKPGKGTTVTVALPLTRGGG